MADNRHGNGHTQGGPGPGSAAPGHAEADEMNLGKIVAVGLGSLAVFAVGIVWSYFILQGRQRDVQMGGPARLTPEMGKQEIGIVDQVLFDSDHRLELWRAERAKELSSWGWVNREQGIAKIPIEKAMEWVVSEPPDIAGEGVPPGGAKLKPPPAAGTPAPPTGRTPPPAAAPSSAPTSPPAGHSGAPR